MIDLTKVREISASKPGELFGSIPKMRPPVSARKCSWEPFPPIKRPTQLVCNWWELAEQSRQAAFPSVLGRWSEMTNFPTKYALGAVQKPYLIAALGIGWGHSLMAFAQGSRSAGIPYATVNGYDEEGGRPGSVEWARQAFIHDRVPYNLGHSSAKDYAEHGIPLSHINLFYISADRTNIEFPRDLDLAGKTLGPNGIMVADETGLSEATVNEWAVNNRFDIQLVDGLYILSR